MWGHHNLQQRTANKAAASGRIFAPEELAGRLHNFVMTEEGTLRTVVGPVEYRPSVIPGEPPATEVPYDGVLKGLFHATVNNRSLLIAHWGDKIYLMEGWGRRWRVIVGIDLATILSGDYQNQRAASTPLSQSDGRPSFTTQFVAMPNGIVIIPQGDRTYFTDGETILPLGYDRSPAPPRAFGPRLQVDIESDNNGGGQGADPAVDADDEANTGGYSYRGRGLVEALGNSRLGTIRNDAIDVEAGGKKSNHLGGILEDGEWRAVTQWQDHFGNLSPASGRSEPVRVHTESNITKERKKDKAESSDAMRFQGAWSNIQKGPPGTVGRILGRSRDLKNSGIPGMWQVPNYSTVGTLQSVTLPGNATTTFPDNIPDSWLLLPVADIDPVPRMSVATQFDGRLWVDDTNTPGLIRPSRPFQWGTFPRGENIWVDTQGNRITGLHAVQGVMLVFTETSTFAVTPNDSGSGYVTSPVNLAIGCVAPGSLQTLPSGLTVWLGREGFYAFDGRGVLEISGDIKQDVIRRINKGYRIGAVAAVDPRMGEYRCAIPVDGSPTNNLMAVYDTVGWRTRDDVHAAALCVTRDTRQLMLALGSASVNGVRENSVWVLDHEGDGNRIADEVTAVYESVWLRNNRAHRNATGRVARFWLRATRKGALTFESFRDGRAYPALQTVVTMHRYSEAKEFTPFWDETVLAGTHKETESCDTFTNYWTRRAPFWVKEDTYIPAAETFKFRITGQGDWEFIMGIYDETDSYGGGAKQQRSD